MRIIAGTARSVPLKSVPGNDTRPTTDRIKETLFNMIQFEVPGCCFLDLFCGNGGIGLEAVSRGASKAVFVDSSRAAADCAKQNMMYTKLNDRCVLLCMDAAASIRTMERKYVFDMIHMDPPYGQGLECGVLQALRGSSVLDGHTKIIIETDLEQDTDLYTCDGCYEITRIKRYKTNQHVFLRIARI